MTEQVHRNVRRTRARDEAVEDTPSEVSEGTAEVLEGAECCLASIDEALAEAEAEQAAKPYAEWTDEERLAAPEPVIDEALWNLTFSMSAEAGYRKRAEMRAEARANTALYDQSYQRVTGLSRRRDCGCGCG